MGIGTSNSRTATGRGQRAFDATGHGGPVKAEPGKVLPESVRVIGPDAPCSGRGKERSPGIREQAGAATRLDRQIKLHPVEQGPLDDRLDQSLALRS